MIIYNVTFKVDWSIHNEWLRWINSEYIPGIIATNHFFKHQLVRLLSTEEADGPTYAVQYYADDISHYHRYIEYESVLQQKKMKDKWGDRYIDFSTVMEVV